MNVSGHFYTMISSRDMSEQAQARSVSESPSKRTLGNGGDTKSGEPFPKKQKPTKVAWIPEVKEGGINEYLISKFGGHPWLEESEDWPSCQNCEKKMAFFLQLNIGELPQVCKSWFNGESGKYSGAISCKSAELLTFILCLTMCLTYL